jgi:hypothetical protein
MPVAGRRSVEGSEHLAEVCGRRHVASREVVVEAPEFAHGRSSVQRCSWCHGEASPVPAAVRSVGCSSSDDREGDAVDVVSTGLRGDELDEWRAHVRIAFLIDRVQE